MKTDHHVDAASSSSSSSSSPTSMGEKPNSKSLLGRLRRKLSPRKADRACLNSIDSEAERPCLNSIDSEATSKYCDDFLRVFAYFDENGDGKISPAELRSRVRTVGGDLSINEAEAAINSSDLDGDGLLDFEEFQKLMDPTGEEEEKKDAVLKQTFKMYEMEGSGCITPTSLKTMFSRLGESKSIQDCQLMIRVFDLNGDGVLSFDEFRIMMH